MLSYLSAEEERRAPCARNSRLNQGTLGLQTQTKEGTLPLMGITFLGKGHTGIFHCGLVHKPIPMSEAMKIPEAKAAVNKEWDKLKNPLA